MRTPPLRFSVSILRDSFSCNLISGPGLQPAFSHLPLLGRKTIKPYMLAIKETQRSLCAGTPTDTTRARRHTHPHLILYDAPGIRNDFN